MIVETSSRIIATINAGAEFYLPRPNGARRPDTPITVTKTRALTWDRGASVAVLQTQYNGDQPVTVPIEEIARDHSGGFLDYLRYYVARLPTHRR